MRRLNRLVMLFVILLLGTSAVSAQAETGWKVVKTELVSDLIGADQNMRTIALSPDGQTLAWGDGQALCLYTIDRAETECYGTPDTFRGFGGNYTLPTWSPDSRSIAFTESIFDYFVDGDIWVFDVESQSFQNRTDDNYLGGLIPIKEEDKQQRYAIDYLPFWNPTNGDLYFFRTIRPEEGDLTLTLQLMPLGRNEPKQVFDFTGKLPVLSVYRQAAISPDGTSLAVIALGNDLKDPLNGVYILNLKSGDLRQVVTVEQFTTGLPAWTDEHNALWPDVAPRWVGNEALVLTLLDTNFVTSIGQSALYIDLTSDSVTALVNFSGIESQTALYQDASNLTSPIYLIPRAGVVTPDASTFIFLAGFPQAREAVISTVALPASEPAVPTQISHIEDFQVNRAATATPQISDDGTRALLYGYLVTLEHE